MASLVDDGGWRRRDECDRGEIENRTLEERRGYCGTRGETRRDIRGGTPEGREEKKPQGKPDIVTLMLERVIDTILLEEVTHLGMKMNCYRSVLAEGILKFSKDHQEDKADLSHLIEAFRQGWKVYRVNEDVKATLDTFMAAMNNQLWQPESM